MTTKLTHIVDLTGKDRYYLCFIRDKEIVQQEINRYEYIELKEAEDKHYNESINNLKTKYKYDS